MTVPVRYDLILRNGSLYDGTGAVPRKVDLAIRGDRISQIGDLELAEAVRVLDVDKLAVAPGFIDVHAHDDAALIEHPQMLPKLTQGVTTVVCGNCGISGAPYAGPSSPTGLLHLVFKSGRALAPSVDDYFRRIREAGPTINSVHLTGHTTLRTQVMGDDLGRPATASEVAEMRDLLTGCLEHGSLGLSTGLFYPPARAATTDEVIEVARPLGVYGGIYATHMRDESDQVAESLVESLRIGREVSAPVIISHHKCMGRRNFGRSVETLAILQEAQKRQSVALDVYPYAAGSTMLSEALVELSSRTVITWSERHPEFSGVDLREAASSLGCTPVEAVTRLLPAGAVYFLMDEEDVSRILRSPEAMVGSDGIPGDPHPHPRLWGTFPRVLGRYVRERKLLSVQEAVYRMTGLPARRLGIQNRGRLEVGQYADLCIFDPTAILDTATFEKPISPAVGIHYVLVNGQVALEKGLPTSVRAGRVLPRNLPADLAAVGSSNGCIVDPID